MNNFYSTMEDQKINKIKSILVTGGLGYIGSHTVNELYNKDYLQAMNIDDIYDVVIIDDCSNCSPAILGRINEMTGANIKFSNCDITNKSQLEEVFKENSFYAVIHFAGKKSVAESQKEPLKYYENNVIGSLNLIQLCLKYQVNNFIFSSSACVYGNRDDSCTEEEEILLPINTYGKTKLIVEQMLRDVSKTTPQFKSVLLRYCNPVAAHKTGTIGENPKGVPANLFPVIENHVRGKTEKLFIFGKDYNTKDGTAIRDYVHVQDIAQGHVLTLQCFTDEKKNLFKDNCVIYNMGTNTGYSVLEVVETYIEANNCQVNYEFTGRRSGDAEKAVPNSDKIAKELGWKPTTTLKEMCRDSYNFIMKNPDGL